jgi:hypothetical protein
MLPWRFASFDLIELGILSHEAIDTIVNVANSHGKEAILRGDVKTSLELPETRLRYRLMDGDQISELLPMLDRLYNGILVELAARALDVKLQISPVTQNGININVLEGTNSRYEWHVDSNPVTGLLVCTEANARTGGRLLFGQDSESQIALSLQAGQFLVFDARRVPHSVEPLGHNFTRITAPMNFFVEGAPIERPTGLDNALYGSN